MTNGLSLSTMADAMAFSTMVSKTEFAPKDFRGKPEACLPGQLPGYKHQLEQAEAERTKLDAQINRLQQQGLGLRRSS